MKFVTRDEPLLWALFEYRYLQSSDLALLAGRSSQVIRRRMRKLCKDGFVVIMRRSPTEEVAYALGPRGYEFIAFQLKTTPERLPFSQKTAKADSFFWRHTLMVNRIRIALVRAAAEHDQVAIRRIVPEWEMHPDHVAHKDPAKKFVLRETLFEDSGQSARRLSFQPDCLFLAYNRAVGPERLVALFLEADRGSESVSRRIEEKYAAYRLYFEQEGAAKHFEAVAMRCLFVLNGSTDRRIRTMCSQLQLSARGSKEPPLFVDCFRFTRADLLTEETVFDRPIWEDWQGTKVPLFNPKTIRQAA